MNRIASRARVRPAALIAAGTLGLALVLPSVVSASPNAVRAELERIAAPRAELARVDAVELAGGAVVRRYRQEVGGIEIRGAEAIVIDGWGRGAELVADDTRGAVPATTADAAPGHRLSSERAIAMARAGAGVRELRGDAVAELVVEPTEGGVERLAWQVSLPSANPVGDHLVVLDASSGAILARADLLRHASGEAKLYLPNPVVANDGYRNIRDRRDRNSRRLNRLRTPVSLARIDQGQKCLRGDYVNAKAGGKARKVCRPSLDWRNVRRSKGAFEALMAYHHVDRTQAYVRRLDVTDEPGGNLNGESQDVVANGFRADNSYYTPFGDRIELGSGGVDDGEDADVIVHEYGHALQDAQVESFGTSTAAGSMGEGFGDYLAAVMASRSAKPPPPFLRDFDVCIFEWDATSYTSNNCARRASRTWTKDFALSHCRREIHCVGEAWSSALWDLRGQLGQDPLGRQVMDRVVIASHFMLDRGASFREAARALLCADEAYYPFGVPDDCEGQHAGTIRDEMVTRRFLP